MTMHAISRSDPELIGISSALRRAQEKARSLARQTGTPFVIRPTAQSAKHTSKSARPTSGSR
jgi:hypothetical protein